MCRVSYRVSPVDCVAGIFCKTRNTEYNGNRFIVYLCMNLTIFTDGGSLNNPGQAAIGYLIYDGKELITKGSAAIGIATNNVAEYTGLITALQKVQDLKKEGTLTGVQRISCIADSELIVKQLNGLYKVKNPDMRDLLMKVRMLENEIDIPITYTHVLREKNAEADALVKKALGR